LLRPYNADLHVHTALSPCADDEMTPPAIVARALQRGLDLIAICDHNAADNVGAMVEAARGTRLRVLPGLEMESREGVHLLCLFDKVKDAWEWQEFVRQHLPKHCHRPEIFGRQLVLAADGRILGERPELLLTATSLGVEDIFASVLGRGGLCLPAHVDRKSNGLLGVLGLVPEELPDLGLVAFEVSRDYRPEAKGSRDWRPDWWPAPTPDGDVRGPSPVGLIVRTRSGGTRIYPLVVGSDAHRLSEIQSGRTTFWLAHANVSELRAAFLGKGERRVEVRYGDNARWVTTGGC